MELTIEEQELKKMHQVTISVNANLAEEDANLFRTAAKWLSMHKDYTLIDVSFRSDIGEIGEDEDKTKTILILYLQC